MRRFSSPDALIAAILLRDEPALADTTNPEDPFERIYHVVTDPEVPVVLDGPRLPLVRVLNASGTRDEITDQTFVDVDVWAPASTTEGYDLAERIADQHIRRRKAVAGFGVLDTVRISIRPQAVAWGDTNVSRHLVQFQVGTRRTGG